MLRFPLRQYTRNNICLQGILPIFPCLQILLCVRFRFFAQKEYANAGPEDVLDMMDDYTEYLKQYAETMEKMEALDNGELSTKEALYYAEVTGQISKKLLEVAQ